MLIDLKDVSYSVPNGQLVYENLNFRLEEGDFVGVLGRNGAGKTTLIDLLMGFRPISSGQIQVLGEDPMSFHRRQKEQIVVLSHDIKPQKNYSVQNYLDFMSFFYSRYDKKKEEELLAYFNLNPKSKMGSLSTGQGVKVQVIAALSASPKLLIMDEVTAVLDPESRKQFFSLMRSLKEQKSCGLILATNIAEDLNGVVDKVLFIDQHEASTYAVEQIEYLFNLKGEAA